MWKHTLLLVLLAFLWGQVLAMYFGGLLLKRVEGMRMHLKMFMVIVTIVYGTALLLFQKQYVLRVMEFDSMRMFADTPDSWFAVLAFAVGGICFHPEVVLYFYKKKHGKQPA